jgi:two-component system copper resistance phosphate regulon response regulator CusR
MRLLIVEDNHKIANVVRDVLMAESFAVDVCYDGEEGLYTALNDDYDLAILDRMLPGGKDGVEICQELRKAGKHMPILILTAKDQVRQRVEGLNAGADDYLIKPFSFDELLARISALLRRPHDNLGTVLTVGDLTLDATSKEVKRGGRSIKISSKEYALLEYLMRNQGKVLKKQHLITHVWDFDADILPNTIEVHMTRLRAKLGNPPLIHTVRGFGYKIEGGP